MSNSLLTINMITREAIELFKNSNEFLKNIDQQYDDSFARDGAKIGQTLRIRLPNDYTVSNGPAAQPQDTTEQSTNLVVATQRHVDVTFSSVDRTMSLDDYSERVLAPMVNNLAGNVAATIMSGVEGGVCNLVANKDAQGNIISPVAQTYLSAKAALLNNSTPRGNSMSTSWKVVNGPITEANTVSSLAGLLNPVPNISEQYRTGSMQQALGFDWMVDQTVINHTSGSFSAGTVAGAGQTGNVLLTNAITGDLALGDIIAIDGVFAVNRVTKQSTGQLRQFVVTAPANSGATQISVYPAIVPEVNGQPVQYQTVVDGPANGAAIRLATPASTTYAKNIAFYPKAITMATADLWTPTQGVVEAARDNYDGVSMRMLTAYMPGTDQAITRLDLLFGFLYIRPEWAVIVCDTVS